MYFAYERYHSTSLEPFKLSFLYFSSRIYCTIKLPTLLSLSFYSSVINNFINICLN